VAHVCAVGGAGGCRGARAELVRGEHRPAPRRRRRSRTSSWRWSATSSGLIKIPLAIKLSPFFTAFANVAHQIDEAGADGSCCSTAFYQPDIDIRRCRSCRGSSCRRAPSWRCGCGGSAILCGRSACVARDHRRRRVAARWHQGHPGGADAVQMVSALLHHGPSYVR
jgi:hypothetical protein